MSVFEIRAVASPDDEPLLARFHRGPYLAAFAAQQEPLEVWRWALWSGEAPYRLAIRIALRDDVIAGGVAFELYPRSGCGLVTYLVVAPEARRRGLGRRLLDEAVRTLYAAGARAVFGEVNDPRRAGSEAPEHAWDRLERKQRWGARIADVRYVQPSLAPGLPRDRGLCLVVLPGAEPVGEAIEGEVVASFVRELYDATEGPVTEGPTPDAERTALLAAIPERIALRELHRPLPLSSP